ncbi:MULTISPECIES: LysR family transcriptional regulator [unclassified Paludibacterium]|uniref:LysR family transcriptional regulator n=1 Tax=unclassified Paludibacterium TaxID=2618429 RepID=UPI001C05E595|nr:LysR family transcriptional regulator [Paludibacterium sp. B53371]BEV71168.1 LysR family transcriptional regulator [Paludibacterium sp. THUN1379]
MDRLTAMRVFVTVVDSGSQSAAAEQLDLSRPVVSRYLAELEQWAGARLLHRTTRRLSLTPAGEQTLPRCRQMLDMASELQHNLRAPDDAPRGLVRVTCSTSFGQAQLAAALGAFVSHHPAVTVDMQLLDRTVNLVEERIDLAIRITNELDPNLIARQISLCRSILCASPDYLQRHAPPRRPEELAQHNCLTHVYAGKSLWHFEQADGPLSVAVSGNLSANEVTSLMAAALAGVGIAQLPTYLAAGELRAGRLLPVLANFRPRDMRIYAVYASRRQMSSALRALVDFLAEYFGEEPAWDQ